MAAAAAPYITRTSRRSSSLHHSDITDITRIMWTSRASARRHHVAVTHSSALHTLLNIASNPRWGHPCGILRTSPAPCLFLFP
ncbi:hypothetical protein STEG23_010492 [Scotinomys teguina]